MGVMQPADLALFLGAVVVLLAAFAARIGTRLGLPALLLFLLVGMLLGPIGFGINFNDLAAAHAIGFAALVLILAEGGLSTNWKDIRPALAPAALLATVGVGVCFGVMTLLGHYVLGLHWSVAALLGAATAPTDSAAVFSVLRGVSLPNHLRSVLEAESGLNDAPTVLVVLALTGVATGDSSAGVLPLLGSIAVQLIGGILVGLLVGWVAGKVSRRITLPSGNLYASAAMAWAGTAYGTGVWIGVSGFSAVYVAAVVIGNGDLPYQHTTRSFSEGIAWICQIGLFVMLGLLANPDRLTWGSVGAGIAAGLLLTLVARPVAVAACTIWFGFERNERLFMSWAGLRGAVPIILATIPMASNMDRADEFFDVILVLVVVFTCIQAPTLPAAADILGVVDPQKAKDVSIEVAPLDEIAADLLQADVPKGSRLAGVTIRELRLPRNCVVSLIIRGDRSFTPHAGTVLEQGDELLIVVPQGKRRTVAERLIEISRGGRLARWHGLRVQTAD